MTNTDTTDIPTDAQPGEEDPSAHPSTLFGWPYHSWFAYVITGLALVMAASAWIDGPEGTHINPLANTITAAVTALAALALGAGRSVGNLRRLCTNFLFGMAAFDAAKALYAWPQGVDGAYLLPVPTTVVALVLLAATITLEMIVRRRPAPVAA